MASTPIRFCVVDDHDVIHDGLAALASREEDLEFGGATTDPEQAVRLVTDQRPEITLLDLCFGAAVRIDLCELLSTTCQGTKVVVFSAHGNAELLESASRHGAAGYILKDTTTASLPAALRLIRETGHYLDPRLAGLALHGIRHTEPGTFRSDELTIVRLIAAGATNHDIGQQLHLSPNTVKLRITDMLRRLDVRRRSELVRLASARQLL